MASPSIEVRVLEGLQADFEHRHRKNRPRAGAAWTALVEKRTLLETDPSAGDPIPRDRWPTPFRRSRTLFRLALPHGFRALYSTASEMGRRIVIIEWIGDHKEYDRLFGYSTS